MFQAWPGFLTTSRWSYRLKADVFIAAAYGEKSGGSASHSISATEPRAAGARSRSSWCGCKVRRLALRF